jgi:Riboflavin kinase
MQVCAYIRPEAAFTTLEALIARIHEDANVTRAALQHEVLARHSTDQCLQPGTVQGSTPQTP